MEKIPFFLKKRERFALCTVIDKKGSGPREEGSIFIVDGKGRMQGSIGGGNLERIVVREAMEAIKLGKSKKIICSLKDEELMPEEKNKFKTGLICGGELTIFINVIDPSPRLIVVGSGHIAKPLAKIGYEIGFEIVIIDKEEKSINKDFFHFAKKIIAGDFPEVLEALEVGGEDFATVVQGEPEYDYKAVKFLLKKKLRYVGLLGSRSKVSALKNKLKKEGIGKEELKKLYAPIGINIHAKTPEEIAISIIAQIVSVKNVESHA